jgi:hypothetical protein
MSNRFIKFIPSEEALYLVRKHCKAFALLTFIAERARRENGHSDGLEIGQCYVGDWENMGLTRQEYRTALKTLVTRKYIKILETCRTRQKSTTGATTVGTLVSLCSSSVYDINSDESNHRCNHRPTTGQPPTNHKEEGIRKKKKEEEENTIAQSAAPLRKKIDSLFFDFEKGQFVGITDLDFASWRSIYVHIDVNVEIAKAVNWLKSNPSKAHKKLWRKFLTGWLNRANESIENKKAFRVASGVNPDRRTRDILGNPVSSPHDGRF